MNSTFSSASAFMSTVAPMESLSGGKGFRRGEFRAGHVHFDLSNFRQKIDRVLSAGLVARVQAARLV
jgi:hypothetical protein